MLTLCVLTTGRQDWGILRNICRLGRASAALDLRIVAGGMALSALHGASIRAMEAEGLAPDDRADWLDPSLSPSEEAGRALAALASSFERQRPDALLLAGDRSETIAAAVAATLQAIPIVHLHGGEETEGAFDNAFRHAITKLSHLHLVSHEVHAARVRALGELASTIHVVGAPGLDTIASARPDRAALEVRLGLRLEAPVVIVTLHPATLGADPSAEVRALIAAMDEVPATYVVTLPNNDPGNSVIRAALSQAAQKSRRVAVEALGPDYATLMATADAMIGNSSSALVEAPALALPAVNIGARQRGRLRAPNVLDVEATASAVAASLRRALEPEFRRAIADESRALYGGGSASARVIAILEAWVPPRPPIKSLPIEG